MNNTMNFGVAVAGAAIMPSPLHVSGPVAVWATYRGIAEHDAIPATKRRAAAATVASVNRGTT